jgi:hypothetical protein
MAQIPRQPIVLTVKVDVQLSFWQACKLRLAGASYLEGYLKCLLQERVERQREEDE